MADSLLPSPAYPRIGRDGGFFSFFPNAGRQPLLIMYLLSICPRDSLVADVTVRDVFGVVGFVLDWFLLLTCISTHGPGRGLVVFALI